MVNKVKDKKQINTTKTNNNNNNDNNVNKSEH